MDRLKDIIRDIPDFPKKGIVFKDITTLLADAKSFHRMVDLLAHRYIGEKIDQIVGIEARGFILGSALAYKLEPESHWCASRGNSPSRRAVSVMSWSTAPILWRSTKMPLKKAIG